MYLWKYWRENRIVIGAALLAITLLFFLIFREPSHGHISIHTDGNSFVGTLCVAFILIPYLQAIPLSFLGWFLGSYGVGHDLGENSGSFIFGKPRSRAYFVWCDWGFSMATLLFIAIFLNTGLWFQAYRLGVVSGNSSRINFPGGSVPFTAVVFATFAATFLLAALVFSITYFSTVLVKHSRGIILGAGILFGYIILGTVVNHYWPGIELPHLILQQYKSQFGGLADHLGISVSLRAGILLLFPIAAQLVLQKTDI